MGHYLKVVRLKKKPVRKSKSSYVESGSVLDALQISPDFIFSEDHYEWGPGFKEQGRLENFSTCPKSYILSILAQFW